MTHSIPQAVLKGPGYPLSLPVLCTSAHTATGVVKRLIGQVTNSKIVPVGIAHCLKAKGQLDFIVLASVSSVYIVKFESDNRRISDELASLLSGGAISGYAGVEVLLVGFSFPFSALHLAHATGKRVRGVDLPTAWAPNSIEPWAPGKLIGDKVQNGVSKWKIMRLWMGASKNDICIQAWLAACIGDRNTPHLSKTVREVDSGLLKQEEVVCLRKMVCQIELLDRDKPTESKNDFVSGRSTGGGNIELINARFKTRVRRSDQTRVIMTDSNGATHVGRAVRVKGKTTEISIESKFRASNLKAVKVLGREKLTSAESEMQQFIFLILTGRKSLAGSPFVRRLWFPKRPAIPIKRESVDITLIGRVVQDMGLNNSQNKVVRAMVNGAPIIVAHGPPGTGKTTTIAAATKIWELSGMPTWIIAHSNVGVKNVAESLARRNVDFKLIVSKEFYVEWHEDLYGEVEDRLVRSDKLPENKSDLERKLGGSPIMLCTLSMLSNPILQNNGTFIVVPMQRLVIDEASQINIYEFMHLFESNRFRTTLQKVCFFGDPKQLPPFGQEKFKMIQTIFDMKHISNAKQNFFLDTQYRMPIPIGAFISNQVYAGRLQSQHAIPSPNCLAFVDVSNGVCERAGVSSKNPREVTTIVHLVKNYYRPLNFCIITFYDAQRAAIQKSLEQENLPANTVFNVDSFQGNEADYVLVSVVRTTSPGFLDSVNRMNVMLTRCKKGLVIVACKSFVVGGGSKTLLGKMANHWEVSYPSHKWIDWRHVSDSSANLPDALGSRR